MIQRVELLIYALTQKNLKTILVNGKRLLHLYEPFNLVNPICDKRSLTSDCLEVCGLQI